MLATLLVFAAVAALAALRFGALKPAALASKAGTAFVLLCVVAAGVLATDRDTWLPFLGESVLPSSLLRLGTSSAEQQGLVDVPVKVDPRATHVAFWAADSGSTAASKPGDAYGSFSNAGVVAVDAGGIASLKVQCPGVYSVGRKTLPKHVHYRECFGDGTIGRVMTKAMDCV